MSSSYSSLIANWLQNNKNYVTKQFPLLPQPWHMAQRRGPAKESGEVSLVLTCLDPRCVPETFFGPDFDGPVIRNAGGRATDDTIRSITVLRELAGLKNVAVADKKSDADSTYADCGVTHVISKEIIDTMATESPAAKHQAEKMDFKLFTSDEFEESIREDVRALRSAPTLAGINIYGFKLDTFTGEIESVDI
ncbi:Carbon disulfide lyase [Cytospora mali]|uniref:Carbon disulfide lyase n=1 Tax=Cytospora mali TaxID=578113 RepID=A0A194UVC7_CYTMA|nr:Carbon disulfide lyase [Valsa mali var. pyri (nom. inval.)]